MPTNSTQQKFLLNLPNNASMALFTVPAEGLAVRRIMHRLDNNSAPMSYKELSRRIGIAGLFQGAGSRVSYCLLGNFLTLTGMQQFGSDWDGLTKTAVCKNILVPVSLFCNARQCGKNYSETGLFVAKGSVSASVHFSFFLRNLLAAYCLWPGMQVREKLFKRMGESNSNLPTALGWMTSTMIATGMNVGLKPFFTGNGHSLQRKWLVASRFTAFCPLLVREGASNAIVFWNLPELKKQDTAVEDSGLKMTI